MPVAYLSSLSQPIALPPALVNVAFQQVAAEHDKATPSTLFDGVAQANDGMIATVVAATTGDLTAPAGWTRLHATNIGGTKASGMFWRTLSAPADATFPFRDATVVGMRLFRALGGGALTVIEHSFLANQTVATSTPTVACNDASFAVGSFPTDGSSAIAPVFPAGWIDSDGTGFSGASIADAWRDLSGLGLSTIDVALAYTESGAPRVNAITTIGVAA